MRSKFAIADHPIHAILVAIPIGLFAWTLVADLAYVGTGKDHMWYDIAFWAGIGAIVSALIAALPGLGDFVTVVAHTEARRTGLLHMSLNLAVVALFTVAMLLMLDDGALDGGRLAAVVALHAVGAGTLLVSGWLGGEMTFRHHIGMIPEDAEAERDQQVRHGATRGAIRPSHR